jgi:hypothetical protein
MAPKKTPPDEVEPGKGTQDEAAPEEANPKGIDSEKTVPKEITPQSKIEETPTSGDCMCKQKRSGGKFFCFKLVQGRWVQFSAVPFPTKELCEEVNC